MRYRNRINNYINTHKYVIFVTGVAVVAIIMLHNQDQVSWVSNKQPKDEMFGFITAG